MIALFIAVFPLFLVTSCSFYATSDPSLPNGMKLISGGTFSMGYPKIAEPIHQVQVSSFYIDSVPVTQRDYQALMHVNPSHFVGDSLRPVETVTWFDAVLYCNARSKAEGKDTVYVYSAIKGRPGLGCDSLGDLQIRYEKQGYRLPTEAEYEYAERAGTKTEFYWGDSVNGEYFWYYANSENTTHPVAQKLPNAYGLYDMAGNILEWCNDWWGAYDPKQQINPTGPANGEYRILRGSSWYVYYLIIHSSAFRFYLEPAPRFHPPRAYFGFRCVLPTLF